LTREYKALFVGTAFLAINPSLLKDLFSYWSFS